MADLSAPIMPFSAPSVDDIAFKHLYEKEHYDVVTNDGWSLVITRYKPIQQAFRQPLFNVPVLCVHGFSQNRHAWTSGEFVKNLLFFGLDVHLLELRGHGKSSIRHQHDRLRDEGLPLPRDIDWGWNFDSYALMDVPAAIMAVKERTGKDKVAYIGHSMGGIIGYFLASQRRDLSCVVTIGAAAELGKDFLPLRVLAHIEPMVSRTLDGLFRVANVALSASARFSSLARKKAEALEGPLKYEYMPIDWLFGQISKGLSDKRFAVYAKLSRFGVVLFNPTRTTYEGLQWILKWGTHKEPRGVLQQMARWVRRREMVIYKTGYDVQKNFERIKVPLAIIFGDRDVLASMKSTRRIYHQAKSEYLLWRPVRGNSHIELTMGHDIRQICYDIKNIVEYAQHAERKRRSLPRKDKPN